jgi:hypothetical protein
MGIGIPKLKLAAITYPLSIQPQDDRPKLGIGIPKFKLAAIAYPLSMQPEDNRPKMGIGRNQNLNLLLSLIL